MGTDIHGVFQRYDQQAGLWEDVPSEYEQQRHYQLFAVLADVRNGVGFAGVTTGEAVAPIAAPRGLPADFLCDTEYCHKATNVDTLSPLQRRYRQPEDPLEVWLGDHSYSWLTGDELLTWCRRRRTVVALSSAVM